MSNQPPPPPPPGGPTSPPPPPRRGPGGGGFNPRQLENAVRAADRQDLALVGAGIVALVFSLIPLWYSVSFQGASDHANAWHGFFPWFGVLVALVGGIFVALIVLKVLPPLPVNGYLVATVLFGLAAVFLLVALFTSPYVGDAKDLCEAAGRSCARSDLERAGFDFGTGVFLSLTFIVVLGAAGLAAFRFTKTKP